MNRENAQDIVAKATQAPLSRRAILQGALGLGALSAIAACSPNSSPSSTASSSAAGTTGANTAVGSAASSALSSPSTNPADMKGEVTLWVAQADLHQIFDTVIPSFNAKYPNIKVNNVQIDVSSKLPTTLVSGAGVPDGALLGDDFMVAQSDNLLDLTDKIQPYKAKLVKYKLDVATVNNKIVGVPFDTDPGVLYYREDILKAAGVDPASIKSYDDLFNAAQAIKAKNPDAKPIHLERDPGLGQAWVEMFANQHGTGMVDPATQKLRLDSAEYREILGWIKKVVDAGLGTRAQFVSPADLKALDAGTEALIPWASWWAFIPKTQLKTSKSNWRVQALPSWTAGGATSGVMGGSSFVIPAKAKNPELMWLFFEHLALTQEGVTKTFGPNSANPTGLNTIAPSLTEELDPSKPLYKPTPDFGNEDMWKIFATAVTQVPPGYTIPKYSVKSLDYFGKNIQKLMDGQMSVDDVIKKSTADIQSNLIDRA